MPQLEAFKSALRRVAEGDNFTDAEFAALRFFSEDPIVNRAAEDAWNTLRRFVDDEDIRERDREYEGWQRDAIRAHLDELEALERGEDPRGRRLPWHARWAKRVGIRQ